MDCVSIHGTMSLFQPGESCGPFEIVRLLGTGGYAEVYEVITPTRERRALKVVAASTAQMPKLQARLAQEGAALGSIVHPNVVRVFDAGTWEDRVWILLELVDGVPLNDKLARGRALPPLDDVLVWIQQACEGIAEAHRMGIVHRDLKPQNLLITASDTVKVIDFGVAKLHGWGVKTTSEQHLGTAMYMSPEQCRREPADPRMDVYSMGLVLYEVIAGKHPMGEAAKNMLHIVNWHLTQEPRRLSEVAPEVLGDLEALVHAAIAKDPSRRLPTMRALADRLREMLLRMQVSQRRAAINVPSFRHVPALAPTVPIPVFDAPTSASAPSAIAPRSALGGTMLMSTHSGTPASTTARPGVPPATEGTVSAPPRAPASVARGTMLMSTSSGAPAPGTARPESSMGVEREAAGAGGDRPALLPFDGLSTLASAQPSPMYSPPSSAPSAPVVAIQATPSAPPEQRSTSMPVASSVAPRHPQKRGGLLIAFAAAAALSTAIGSAWVLRAHTEAPRPAASVPTSTSVVTATAQPIAPPSPTSSASAAPTASASAKSRSPRGAPSQQPAPRSPSTAPGKAPAAKNRLFNAEP